MGLRDAVIAGYAETKITQRSGSDPYALAGDIVNSLLVRTGFEKAEVDGLIMSPSLTAARTTFWAQCVAEFLGLELTYCDTTDLGGCSPAAGVTWTAHSTIRASVWSRLLCAGKVSSHSADACAAQSERLREVAHPHHY